MSTLLQRSGIAFIGAFLFVSAFAGIAHAQSVRTANDCPTDCAAGTSCYQVTNSAGQTAKSCLTPAMANSMAGSGTSGGLTSTGQTAVGPGGQTLVNPLKADNLEELLQLVLTAAIRIGTIVLILMLVWVGFLFVRARGKEEEIRTARQALFWTVIGGLILLGARGISEVIQATANTL